ncbi:MAG: hypothetical protein U9N35_07535 [Euryarchaeota archaeon]|nr:hypothetical protein [Euryarchaeota archaeon]
MKNNKKIVLSLFLFFLFLGFKGIYTFFYYYISCRGECGANLPRVLSFMVGTALIYLSFRVWREESWRKVIPSSYIVSLASSLYFLSLSGEGVWDILHPGSWHENWIPSYHEFGSYIIVIGYAFIAFILLYLALKLYRIKENGVFNPEVFSLACYALFIYGLVVIYRSVFLLDLHFGAPSLYYDPGIVYIAFRFSLGVSLVLLLVAHKIKKSEEIPLLGILSFYGLSAVVYNLMWARELCGLPGVGGEDILLHLLPIFIGIVSITLALLIFSLETEETKRILKKRYQIA